MPTNLAPPASEELGRVKAERDAAHEAAAELRRRLDAATRPPAAPEVPTVQSLWRRLGPALRSR